MSTKKLQILGSFGNKVYTQPDEPADAVDGSVWIDLDETAAGDYGDADTLDGKHASDFVLATDMVAVHSDISELQTKVGDTAVSAQISNAIVNKVDKSEIGNAGITNISYTPLFGGQFSVTTVQEDGYIKPHAQASVTGIFSQHNDYRSTVNGVQYKIPCEQYFEYDDDSKLTIYNYIGNLSLYSENISGLMPTIRDVPFLIKMNADQSVDVFTSEPIELSILVERMEYTKEMMPKTLIFGQADSPIKSKVLGPYRYNTSIGVNSVSSEDGGVAIGWYNMVSGKFANAFGYRSKASGAAAHAECYDTTASGETAHAEGYSTLASGQASHAEGCITTAVGHHSHAEGNSTTAAGYASHAGGTKSEADGVASFAHGNYVKAVYPSQFIVGYGNNPQADSIFEVGNGLNEDGTSCAMADIEPATRQNAFRVTKNGVAIAQTGLQIGNTTITEAQLQQLLALIG